MVKEQLGQYLAMGYFTTWLLIIFFDLKYRTIPNWLVLLVTIISIITVYYYGHDVSLWLICIFVFGLILFDKKLMGGGDVKLLLAYFIAIDPEHYIKTFFVISIIGALILISYKILDFVFSNSADRKQIPYGPAVGGGGVFGILMSSL